MSGMTEIVAADIGGTHARFSRAILRQGAAPVLGPVRTYKTADFPDIGAAWRRFADDEDRSLPSAASFAVAAPIDGGLIRFTNGAWTIDPSTVAAQLGIDDVFLLNDFGAMGHAVAHLDHDSFVHIAGPTHVPPEGVTTIVGPGTGLGVAMLLKRHGRYEIIETEGGHTDFAPLDPIEQRILEWLRLRFTRVSTERIVSGPGLANIYEALAAIGGSAITPRDDASLWRSALEGNDPLLQAALDRFMLSFGSILGDLALAHGANQVVIVGGLGSRLLEHLKGSAFYGRFCAKGRYAPRMERFPIRLAHHEQPGLMGAAAAFAARPQL